MNEFPWSRTDGFEQLADPADYAGGSLVDIVDNPSTSKTAADRARSERWRAFFAAAPPITGLMLGRPRQETLGLLPLLPQLRGLRIGDLISIRDIEPLGRVEALEGLFLGYPRKIDDYRSLARLPRLRHLVVFAASDDLDYSSFGGLVRLEHLHVARGGKGGTARVESLDWVEALTSLQTLQLLGVVPTGSDVSALARLPRLTDLLLGRDAELRRRVERLAPSHAAFAGLAREYALGDKPRLTKWKRA